MVNDARTVIDWCRTTEAEALITKSIDCISDEGALYEAILRCDAKLNKLTMLTAEDALHPAMFNKFEQVLS